MKLEYLYPELGNLYGDGANMRYLRKCLPQAEYIETHIGETPAFVSDPEICFLYSGSMTERGQGIALEELRPYAGALADRIKDGLHGLFTGNSMELPGKSIVTDDETLEGLGIIELRSRRDIAHRYNGFFLGNADGIEITAFNSRFSHSIPGAGLSSFAKVTRGIGLDPDCAYEGYRTGNFIGTYLLGPLLVLNPLLTQRLMGSLGCDDAPACFTAALQAYEARLTEFRDSRRKLD
jgi:CobQ-like glutamine amidotransferase family enzyme